MHPRTGVSRPGRAPRPPRAPLPERAPGPRPRPAARPGSGGSGGGDRGTGASARRQLPASPPALAPGLHAPLPPHTPASPPPGQMQAVALPEEIRWLMEGNALAQPQAPSRPPGKSLRCRAGGPTRDARGSQDRPLFPAPSPTPASRTSRLLEPSTLHSQIFILPAQGPVHSPQFHVCFLLRRLHPSTSPPARFLGGPPCHLAWSWA